MQEACYLRIKLISHLNAFFISSANYVSLALLIKHEKFLIPSLYDYVGVGAGLNDSPPRGLRGELLVLMPTNSTWSRVPMSSNAPTNNVRCFPAETE